MCSTYDSLDVLVLPVDLLHPEDVIAEVQALEPPLLTQEDDEHAAGPVQALAEQLLDVVLVLANRNAIDELERGPEGAKKRQMRLTS